MQLLGCEQAMLHTPPIPLVMLTKQDARANPIVIANTAIAAACVLLLPSDIGAGTLG